MVSHISQKTSEIWGTQGLFGGESAIRGSHAHSKALGWNRRAAKSFASNDALKLCVYFASRVVKSGRRKWCVICVVCVVSPTKRVRDMRGMRGKSDEKGA